MNRSAELLGKDRPSFESLWDDFNHPNPYINKQAALSLALYWEDIAIEKLIENLDNKDITLRRKSVSALGLFGQSVLSRLVKFYLGSEDRIRRSSCLKIFVKIASSHPSIYWPDDVMNVIKLALEDETPEIILISVSFLRQLNLNGIPLLIKISRDENVLRASAAITALAEMEDPSIEKCFNDIIKDNSMNSFIHQSAVEALHLYKDRFI